MNFKEWKLGLKHGIPICLGYFAVSFAFGIQAGSIGLTVFQTFLMSITNVTSAGQFSALGVIAAGSSYIEMACTQLLINMRYLLMSCALSQKVDTRFAFAHRFGMAYGVTDEIFGSSICHPGPLNPFYTYGLMSSAIPGWGIGTLLGIICGNILPENIISALGIAIYGMFVAIIIPTAKVDRRVMTVIIAAMSFSFIFKIVPFLAKVSSGFQIIIITVVIASAAALLFPRTEEEEDAY